MWVNIYVNIRQSNWKIERKKERDGGREMEGGREGGR